MSNASSRPDPAPGGCDPAVLREKKLDCLTTMAAGVAHSFNNYMTAIVGNNDLVLQYLPADSPARIHAEQIRTTANLALKLTDEIALYAARARRKLKPVILPELVDGLARRIETSVCRHVRVVYRCRDDTPVIRADPDQVRLVVLHLVANASNALVDTTDGRITIATGKAECDAEFLASTYFGGNLKPGVYGFVEVSDNGPGIAPEAMEKIFDPFFSSNLRGRGLGLPVVIGISRAHLGAIVVNTDPLRGAAFRALFPVPRGGA